MVSAAFDLIKGSIDGAISRYDTLTNFPKVMQQMGYSAAESQASITKLSEGIQGLPTALDDIVASTKSIALLTGDLEGATDTALALNNAFYASGASASDASRGLIQYTQMLSKGTVDMQSWRTLQETMGYALRETAEAFGFAGEAAVNDLYAALQSGQITFTQFNDKIVELSNSVGGFAETASVATGGIGTAMTNLQTRTVMGVTSIIGAIDEGFSETRFGSIENIINTASTGIKNSLQSVAPVAKALAANIDVLAVSAGGAVTAFAAYKVVTNFVRAQEAATKAVKTAQYAQALYTASLTKNNAVELLSNTIKLKSAASEGVRTAAKKVGITVDTEGILVTSAGTRVSEKEAAAVLASAGALSTKTIVTQLLAGKITIATAAQELWNKAMAANPIGAVIAGVAILAGVVALAIKAMDTQNETLEKMKEAAQEAADAVDNMNEIVASISSGIIEIDATASAVERYIDRLEELGEKSSMTTAEQEEYKRIVGEINRIMPDLNVTINEQTGLIDENTDALRNNTAVMKERFIAEKRQEGLTELWEEEYAALIALEKAQSGAADATAKHDEAVSAYESAGQRMIEIVEEATAAYNALSDSEKANLGYTIKLPDEYYQLEASQEGLGNAITDTRYAMEDANQLLDEAQGKYDEATLKVNDYEEETKALTNTIGGNAAAMDGWTSSEKYMAESVQGLTAELYALEEAYQVAYNKAHETITGQVGLFDTFESETSMSAAKMMEVWEQQAQNVQTYADNISFASQYLNDDLIAAWSDGTSESAGYIQGFTDELQALIDKHGEDSDEVQTFVDNFNAAYEGTSTAKDTWASNVAEMETDFENSMTNIEERMAGLPETMTMTEEATIAANSTVQGYIAEFEAQMENMREMGSKLGRAVMDGYNSELRIESPSRVAMQSAGYTVMGFTIPFIKAVDELYDIGKDMGGAVSNGFASAPFDYDLDNVGEAVRAMTDAMEAVKDITMFRQTSAQIAVSASSPATSTGGAPTIIQHIEARDMTAWELEVAAQANFERSRW